MSFNFYVINKKESVLIEILKIFLLLQVVIGHALALSFPKISNLELDSFSNIFIALFKFIFSFGRESAYLFVFLSGFFTAKVFNTNSDNFNLINVFKTRINRIYPVFTIALILTFLLDMLGLSIFKFSVYNSNSFNFSTIEHLTFYSFLSNFLSLQPTFAETFGTNTPLWTLGYLVQFYFLAAIVRKIANIYSLRFAFVITGVILVTSQILSLEFAILFFVWYAGMLVRSYNFKIFSINIIFIFIVILASLLISRFESKYMSMLLTPITGFFILFFVKKTPEFLLGYKVSDFSSLPDISYSLYAIHMPILFLIYGIFETIFKEYNIIVFKYIYVILSFVISIISSVFIMKIATYIINKKYFKYILSNYFNNKLN